MTECLETGIEKLAQMLSCSERTAWEKSKEFVEAGVAWYEGRGAYGRRTLCFFPSAIKAYLIKKAGSKK